MSKDRYKEQFAGAAAAAFQKVYPDKFAEAGQTQVFDPETVYGLLEKPKDASMGRFALPVFRHARLLGDKPPAIADKVAAEMNNILKSEHATPLVSCVGVAGFLNAQVDFTTLARETISDIVTEEDDYGSQDIGKMQKFLVEYSSPNIAKPFGIGHLRSTVIGNSLRLIFKKLGFDVVGINYPGDWGTQFGKMIVAYEKWGDDKIFEGDAVKNLLTLYVRFHEEAEKDKSLDEDARAAFKRLESGDQEAVALWKKFKTISHAEFDRVYALLGVEFDKVIGESFYNDKMEAVVERLTKDGLTKISQGALIVDLEDPNLPPALLKKADGGTLYMTRDLAGLIYRWDTYHFFESIYVVGTAQSDYFKQALKVIAMMEDAEKLSESDRMTGKVKHIDFGWVKFENRTMSTRRGQIIFLEDVINEAVDLAKKKILEKNPDLAAIDDTAHMIGVGAVLFSQLSVRRQKDVNFIWEIVLNFEGETGPYLQYTHARLCSLMRNYDGAPSADVNFSLLEREEEQRVIELLADFPDAIADAARNYDPYFIASYLIRLSGAFNKVYQRKDESGRIDKIISDNKPLSAARIALVKSVQLVIKEGLHLLGLQAPEEM